MTTERTSETREVFDPFLGKTVEIDNNFLNRLRGKYACGPTLANGEPEFGYREFQTPPIQHEAAAMIEDLRSRLAAMQAALEESELSHLICGVIGNCKCPGDENGADASKAMCSKIAAAIRAALQDGEQGRGKNESEGYMSDGLEKITIRMRNGQHSIMNVCGNAPPRNGNRVVIATSGIGCFAAELTPSGWVIITEPVRLYPVT